MKINNEFGQSMHDFGEEIKPILPNYSPDVVKASLLGMGLCMCRSEGQTIDMVLETVLKMWEGMQPRKIN